LEERKGEGGDWGVKHRRCKKSKVTSGEQCKAQAKKKGRAKYGGGSKGVMTVVLGRDETKGDRKHKATEKISRPNTRYDGVKSRKKKKTKVQQTQHRLRPLNKPDT